MQTTISHFSPANSDFAYQPSPETEFASLFEQCGIPLADLGVQVNTFACPITEDETQHWYKGTAPKDGDVVDLEGDGTRSTADSPTTERPATESLSIVKYSAETTVDGLGNSNVSHLRGQHSAINANSVSHHDKPHAPQSARHLLDQLSEVHHEDRSHTSPPLVDTRLKTPSSPETSSTTPHSQSPRKSSTPASTVDQRLEVHMDFYSQQQFYAGAHLSSPISMQSCPEEDDTFLFSNDYSQQFGSFVGQDFPGSFSDSEAMRRSFSTPFPSERSAKGYGNPSAFEISPCPDESSYSAEEVVPASDNKYWKANRDYLLPMHHINNGLRRPAMKRKNRPVPIATSQIGMFSQVAPHTAPLERRMMMQRSTERPPLSAKRSFEDFSEIESGQIDVPAYRHISTPISKRARSSQGFSTIPASPYVDEPLFSPVYNDAMPLTMDPEQLLLSSPPYSQADFCSSPNYIMQNLHDPAQNFLAPSTLQCQEYLYDTQEPLTPVDIEGVWAQKPSFYKPAQVMSVPVSVPRTLNYVTSSPVRKSVNKPRRPSTAKTISFCNYTAADRKTILSGVAPSGSNKKALAKSQDMNRTLSSGPIAV